MAKKDDTIGEYRVLEEIASGSSGRVYRAEDPKHKNTPVAIKLLHSASLSSQQERDRFLQEARFLTLLKHPNILPVLDVGFEKDLPYIVTEFASHGSLLDYLKKLAPRPLPASEALYIVIQVGQALQYAHSQNIIHRDLKPANILFSANGTAMLADFGIATVLANSMQYGTVIGTPSYMAPEQFRGTISKEGDQYALGCITYELVTGRRPFSAADFFTLGAKHMSETPIPPTQLNILLSHSLDQVIFKAMAKKRNERYPNIAAFIAALSGGVQLPVSQPSMASTYAPAMRLDKNMSVKPFSPAGSLPRALNGSVANMHAITPSLAPYQGMVGTNALSGGEVISRPPSLSNQEESFNDDGRVPGRSTPTYIPAPPQIGNGGLSPGISPVIPPVQGKQPWSRKRKVLATAVILLVVLLIASTTLITTLKVISRSAPAMSTATVTIVPTDPTRVGTFTITAVLGKPNAATSQVQARKLTATMQQTHTIASSGVGVVPATVAHGWLTIFNDSTSPQPFSAGTTYKSNDGVLIISTQSGVVPAGNPKTNPPTWQSVTVSARALKAGRAGNISVTDVNIWTANGIASNYVVENKAPFSGGRDTVYYPVVEKNDLISAVTPLTRTLLRNTQTAVIAQVQSNEQIAASTRCSERTAYNHQVGDHAATVSAVITATCTLEAYDQQGAYTLAINLLRHRLTASGSTVLNPFFTATVVQEQVLDTKGTISLLVNAVNTEFSSVQLQSMARSIAGKSSQDAQTTLLHSKGVKQVAIYIHEGDGQTLPADATRITMTVLS